MPILYGRSVDKISSRLYKSPNFSMGDWPYFAQSRFLRVKAKPPLTAMFK
jgi:hypothetical protein